MYKNTNGTNFCYLQKLTPISVIFTPIKNGDTYDLGMCVQNLKVPPLSKPHTKINSK
jgi:hypothetical protein